MSLIDRYNCVRQAMQEVDGPWTMRAPMDAYMELEDGTYWPKAYWPNFAANDHLQRSIILGMVNDEWTVLDLDTIANAIFEAWPIEYGICGNCESPCPRDHYLCRSCM